jgi:2-oxoglutarate dehydrogenase E2 component (dihydrolipoamide succinyltransferase)
MDVLMPQLGETVAEGTVAAWHKQVGDKVEVDEILLDVETDKVSMEIPAPRAGTLAKILVQTGETVDVGTVLAVIQNEGETAADDAPDSAPAAAASASPASGGNGAAHGGNGTDASASAASVAARSDTQRLSPAVRRLVAEHQIDLDAVRGTGRNGRITRRNVVEFLEGRASSRPGAKDPTAAAAQPPAESAGKRAETYAAPAGGQIARPEPSGPAVARAPAPSATPGSTIPFNRIRRLTADHMVKSKATSPHVLQAVEVDFSGVDRVRKAMNPSWKAQRGWSLTYLPFIAHATCAALREFPKVNSSIGDNELILHAHVNLAFAVDLGPEGLVAPVIKSAETLTVTQLAESINDLAGRARSNRLRPDDLSGGTYTLSNSGTFGTLITAPIINQPQVAILSTDGVRKKPVVIEHPAGDSIGIRPVGILAQSFDHRAIDGAYSAAFLDRIRKLLEQTDWYREV